MFTRLAIWTLAISSEIYMLYRHYLTPSQRKSRQERLHGLSMTIVFVIPHNLLVKLQVVQPLGWLFTKVYLVYKAYTGFSDFSC